MKITIRHYKETLTQSVPDDANLDQMCVVFSNMLRGLGYRFKGELEIADEEDDG